MTGFSQSARSVLANWLGNGPWRSKSVRTALIVVVIGLGVWVSKVSKGTSPAKGVPAAAAPGITSATADPHWDWNRPVPFYVKLGASYAAAYCLGWLFRRLLRLLFIASVLAFALLLYGKFSGWDLTRTQVQVKHGSHWARHTATTERDHLKKLLPSATAGAVGMFLGFWRRNKTGTARAGNSPDESKT